MNILDFIDSEDPIKVVWNVLNDIWQPRGNVGEYYKKSEEVANEIEREIKNVFYEIYDILHEQIINQHRKIELPAIVVDGMSVREGNLIREDLSKNGYAVKEYSYNFSFLPSVTNEFTKRVFNASSESAIKGDFRYEQVLHGKIPFESLEDTFVVWISFPDEIAHHAGKILQPEEWYERTIKTLLEVLKKVKMEEVSIISDHGYIFIDRMWALGKKDSSALRSIVGSKRFIPIKDVGKDEIEELKKIPEHLSYVKLDENYCYFKGRYGLPAGGQSLVTHGGLSFMECLIPTFRVKL